MAKIPIILEPGRADGKLATSGAIFDENKGIFQSEINDIQDTLNSDNPNKPLSAKQGKILKELLDNKVIEAGSVPIDAEPIEGNITHLVNSDGLAKEFNKCNTTIINTDRIANEAIVSSKLSNDIQSLISNLSKTATFAGIATPTTNPGTPDGPVFYIATTVGSYSNFGNIEISKCESAILKWNNGIWTKNTFKPMTDFNSVFDANGNSLTYELDTLDSNILELGLKIGFEAIETDYTTSNYSNLLWGGTTDGWVDTTNKEGRNSFIIPLYPNQTFTLLRRKGTIVHQKVFDYRPQQGLKKNSIADVQGDTYTNNSSNLVYITYGWITNEVHTLKYKVSGVGIAEELNTTIERTDSIEKDLNDLNKIVKGVSPIKGISFTESDNVNIVKNNLKSAWLEIIDSTFDLNKTCYMSVVINEESRHVIQCFTQKGSIDGNLCLSYISGSQAITEKEIVLNGYNTYKDKVKLHLVFDFANFGIHHFTTLEIAMNLSDMHTSKIDDNGLVFEVEKLKDDVLNFSKPLVGKTIVCFGDSITEFKDEKGKRYSDYLAEFTGAEIINVGIGGTMLKQRKKTIVSPTETIQDAYACLDIVNLISAVNSNDFTNQELASNYLKTNAGDDNTAIVSRLKAIDWSKVDAVTFFAGTNDWWTGSDSFSDSSSITITNSAGAVNTIITTLLSKYPTLKIFWFTPIVRWNPGNSGERTDENWSDNLKNYTKTEDWQPEPKTLGEWADSIESGVRKRHIPCCNLYWSLGWNQYNFNSFFSTTDGTHPTKGLGMKKIADTIASFILSMGL